MPTETDVKGKKSQCCVCAPSWTKTFLIFFTLILMAIALAFICLGVYFTLSRSRILSMLLSEMAFVNTYLLIGIGILLTIVCSFGLIALAKNNPSSIKTYAIFLALAFFLQLGAAATALVYYKISYEWNADKLALKMRNDYHSMNNELTRAVDVLQREFQCCGARDYRDWHGTAFENNSKIIVNEASTRPVIVPSSCCIGRNMDCGKIVHPSNVYYKGCISRITDELNSTLFIICVVLLSLAIVEIAGVILACCYRKAPHYTYN